MKKMLFPTDFSGNANHALSFAIGLCESLEADLILFHACRTDALVFQEQNEEQSEEKIIFDSKKQLTEYREKFIPANSKINIIEKVAFGLAVDVILETAAEMEVDMIIMGTKGASGLEEVLLGSNTAAVMEKARCPVLAVPAHSEFRPIEQIAFATDFREHDADAIIYLSSIAKLFDAKLVMVHVADSILPGNYEQALFRVFEDEIRMTISYKNLSFETIKGSPPAKALNQFATENKMDLVAVSTRKKNLYTRLFEKSFTRQLAHHSTVPVLAFHE